MSAATVALLVLQLTVEMEKGRLSPDSELRLAVNDEDTYRITRLGIGTDESTGSHSLLFGLSEALSINVSRRPHDDAEKLSRPDPRPDRS